MSEAMTLCPTCIHAATCPAKPQEACKGYESVCLCDSCVRVKDEGCKLRASKCWRYKAKLNSLSQSAMAIASAGEEG